MKIIRRIAEPFKHVEIRETDADGIPINHYVIAPGDDYAFEPQDIKDICAMHHTPTIISAYQAHLATQ